MKYTAYSNRKDIDVLFPAEAGTGAYTGRLADTIKYIQDAQLMDPALWCLFADQFRIGNPDDRDNGWRCEYWGKMMRGACFTYEYTRDPALYTVLENSVKCLLEVQDELGRFSTYSVGNEFHGWDMWGRKYVLLGFQYFLEICTDDALADRVVEAMRRHTDYIMSKIGPEEEGKLPIYNTSDYWLGINSSSILEPVVRLYNITGDKKYLGFAKYILDSGAARGFNLFEAALEGKLHPYEYPVNKAYEMMSCFEGVIEYYRVVKNEKYRTMVKNFARLVIDSDITVIGSAGTTHELFDHSKVRQFNPEFSQGIMQETCVTVTWMKFCLQMLCLTGKPIYADQIEKAAYNGLLGAVNVNKNGCTYYTNQVDKTASNGLRGAVNGNKNGCAGEVFEFDSYSPLLNSVRGKKIGGHKDLVKGRFYWGCCVAIGAAGTGLIPKAAVMSACDGVTVNFFMPGKCDTTLLDKTKLTVNIEGNYPVSGDVSVKLGLENVSEFTLHVRVPAWSTDTKISVGGREYPAVPGEYTRIKRMWHDGDVIKLSFDMRTKIIRAAELDPAADEASVCHAALQRGPIMLARDSQFGEDITEAVCLADNNGYAEVEAIENTAFTAEQTYRVKTSGGYITVADYASAGQNWDADKPITVWLTTGGC